MPTPNLFSRLYCRLARHFDKCCEDGIIIKFLNKREEKSKKRWKKHDEYLKLLSFDPYDGDWFEVDDDGVFSRDPKNLHRFM